jgi:hypothetical protein
MAYDAILIPGGGLIDADTVPLRVQRRLDRVLEIYGGEMLITLSAGTTYKPPPLDARGFPITEAFASARYLVAHGIDPDRVLTENVSYDTIGNAYFSRVIHTEPTALRRLHVVTSTFHMPRTEAIFRWVFGLTPSQPYTLTFETVTDDGMEPAALQSRVDKERASLARLNAIIPTIDSLSALHRWLYTEHTAYAMRNNTLDVPPPPPKAIDTY